MPIKILADESVDYRIVKYLKKRGHNIISVLDEYKGIRDKKVIELAKKFNCLILTEDSDFGEWVFAHGIKDIGVIFLRYKQVELLEISESIIRVLSKYSDNLFYKFVVITTKKIRIRDII